MRIDGDAVENATLVASHTLVDADGAGPVSYQWLADGVAIDGATGDTLTLTDAHVGHRIQVAARYTDARGTAEQVLATATGPVANVNDAPTALALAPAVVMENTSTAGGLRVGTLSTTDEDLGDTHAYSLVGGADRALFEIRGDGLFFRSGVVLNAENRAAYQVVVRSSDGLASVDRAVVVQVADQNEFAVTRPVFDVRPMAAGLTPNTVIEESLPGASTGVRARASDADATGNAVTYALAGDSAGTTAYAGQEFSIDAASGEILVAGRIDRESGGALRTLFVRATSADGSSAVSSITLSVHDVNDLAPVFASGAAATVSDRIPAGIAVYTARATDADATLAHRTVTYRLKAGGDAAAFEIDATTGAVTRKADTDFATRLRYDFVVEATDGVHVTEQAVVLTIQRTEIVGTAGDDLLVGLAGPDVLRGLEGHDTMIGGTGSDTMIGGAGDDTYVLDTRSDVVVEEAGGGIDTIRTSVSRSLDAHVENLVLTDLATLGNGNDLANVITGNTLANVLDGRAGADTMIGGAGDDTYVLDARGDVVTEEAGGGIDTIRTFVSRSLDAHVENLVLAGAATVGNGNDLANAITGNALANLLDGRAGADTLAGGAGDDTYVVDALGDVVIEAADGGLDTVRSFVNRTLEAHVENLVLAGSTTSGTGNELANVITGNAASNVLDGRAGADTLIGGAGHDTYVLDTRSDVVVEEAGGGIDTIRTSVSRSLDAHVENLVLTDLATLGNGNDLANVITGNTLANVLDGRAGADTMIGGAGDDTYVLDARGDVVTEEAGGGIDTIRTFVSRSLDAHVENLVLAGAATVGNGNDLANAITGNALANLLDGRAGADTLAGGAGDDTYVVDALGDVVIEAADGGLDTVRSFVNRTLEAHVENLVLTGMARIGQGNELDNVLTGNAQGNALNGKAGSDTLIGGEGNDRFVFDSVLDALTNVDTLADFAAGDRIVLDNDVFAALGAAGTLHASLFHAGAGVTGAASGQGAGLYYDTAEGVLYYDADGHGGTDAVEFVNLAHRPGLTAADFLIQE